MVCDERTENKMKQNQLQTAKTNGNTNFAKREQTSRIIKNLHNCNELPYLHTKAQAHTHKQGDAGTQK